MHHLPSLLKRLSRGLLSPTIRQCLTLDCQYQQDIHLMPLAPTPRAHIHRSICQCPYLLFLTPLRQILIILVHSIPAHIILIHIIILARTIPAHIILIHITGILVHNILVHNIPVHNIPVHLPRTSCTRHHNRESRPRDETGAIVGALP